MGQHPLHYLDCSATTPMAAEVQEAMRRCQQEAWGNPSSLHGFGLAAMEQLERQRQRLAPQQGEIAQQLAVERFPYTCNSPCAADAYHDSSDGDSLCALVSIFCMRPSPRCSTRSAIAEIAALCVMTMVVVPSSWLMRSMTSSTRLPVW